MKPRPMLFNPHSNCQSLFGDAEMGDGSREFHKGLCKGQTFSFLTVPYGKSKFLEVGV